MDNATRLEMLQCLRPKRGAEALQTHRDVIEWQAAVAPLLDFNEVYYINFVRLADVISTIGLTSHSYDPAFRQMERIIRQAIAELQQLSSHPERSMGPHRPPPK